MYFLKSCFKAGAPPSSTVKYLFIDSLVINIFRIFQKCASPEKDNWYSAFLKILVHVFDSFQQISRTILDVFPLTTTYRIRNVQTENDMKRFTPEQSLMILYAGVLSIVDIIFLTILLANSFPDLQQLFLPGFVFMTIFDHEIRLFIFLDLGPSLLIVIDFDLMIRWDRIADLQRRVFFIFHQKYSSCKYP